jgi:hypothetical protein
VTGGDGLVVVEAGSVRPGDLNGDSVIDSNDLVLLEPLLYRDDAGGAADVNGDTLVNAADLVALSELL